MSNQAIVRTLLSSFALFRHQRRLFAATVDLPGGSYAGPGGPLEMWGYPTLVGRSADASDPDTARWLWDASERLTGVTYGLARTSDSAAG